MTNLRTFFLAVIVLMPALVNAQWHGADVPDSLSFQGFLTDTSGTAVTDGDYDLLFRMYKGSTKVWEQTHSVVPVKSGGFNVILSGSVTWPLDTVAFNQAIDLGITINGGSELTPRTPLTSAAYALGMRGLSVVHAKDASNRIAPNLIGGASNNYVAQGVVGATIGGGGGDDQGAPVPDSVLGRWGTVGGGLLNTAGPHGTVGGGAQNRALNTAAVGGGAGNSAAGYGSIVGGGVDNSATGVQSSIGGGNQNRAIGVGATVQGGENNAAAGEFSSIGGGRNNIVVQFGSTIGGGYSNWASGDSSAIGGGSSNLASRRSTVIAGGSGNKASGAYATVGGGQVNLASKDYATVSGGAVNQAGEQSVVGGGVRNEATGVWATIPGGWRNAARGNNTFAAGYNAKAVHEGSFVWNDRSQTLVNLSDSLFTTADNQFLIRAAGGVGIGTNAPGSQLTVHGVVESDSLGFKFPDGSIQTSAAGSGAFWALTGNSGTIPGTNFIGTTDSTAIEVRVNSSRVLRIEPAGDGTFTAPNLIGGASNNFVDGGVVGATIGGGGGWLLGTGQPDSVLGNYGTIGGGRLNTVAGQESTVGGGVKNRATGGSSTIAGGSVNSASGTSSAISGGSGNDALGLWSSIGGGFNNSTLGDSASVGGGNRNSASGLASSVAGGGSNVASGNHSTVGGGAGNEASGNWATVGGGVVNDASGGTATVGGGSTNTASGIRATVGGGVNNTASGFFATVGGGDRNTASGLWATVPGGLLNRARGNQSLAAGYLARANHLGSFVWGDGSALNPLDSLASTAPNQFLIRAAGGVGIGTNAPGSQLTVHGVVESDSLGFKFPDGTIQTSAAGSGSAWSLTGNAATTPGTDFIGTSDNTALEIMVNSSRALRIEPADNNSPNLIGGASKNFVAIGVVGATIAGGGSMLQPDSVLGDWGTVSGGALNTASGVWATVGGGHFNTASGSNATVGGGVGNTASGSNATVGGGVGITASGPESTVGGGSSNTASGLGATVGGGVGNTASGSRGTVGGGVLNSADGDYATVPGGRSNKARGDYSLAAGYNAKAGHVGSFVWNDRSQTLGSLSDSLFTTAENQFLVRAAGGVGIGTNRPKPGMTISRETQGAAHQLELRNVGGITNPNFDGIAFTQGATGATTLGSIKLRYLNNGTTNMSFSVRGLTAAATDLLFLKNDGRVGIGTTTPTEKLEVNGNVLANNVNVPSDRRLKRNIRSLTNSLDTVGRLRGVSYEWRTDEYPDRAFEDGRHIGFIAQDVEDVVPEAVQVGSDGTYSMRYQEIIPILVEAVKELSAKVESQQVTIGAQSGIIKQLDDRLTAVEAPVTN